MNNILKNSKKRAGCGLLFFYIRFANFDCHFDALMRIFLDIIQNCTATQLSVFRCVYHLVKRRYIVVHTSPLRHRQGIHSQSTAHFVHSESHKGFSERRAKLNRRCPLIARAHIVAGRTACNVFSTLYAVYSDIVKQNQHFDYVCYANALANCIFL